jgi:hypothetical protein
VLDIVHDEWDVSWGRINGRDDVGMMGMDDVQACGDV